MRSSIERILTSYAAAQKENFANHPLAQFIRDNLKSAVEGAIGYSAEDYKITASPGQGVWAAVPWVAVFDPLVTTTAQKGYYVVLLFAPERGEIVFSLNQGATEVIEEFGSKGYKVLEKRASLMRSKLADSLALFPAETIDLGSTGRLPRGYEASHILGKTYNLSDLPDNEELVQQLRALLTVYRTLTFKSELDTEAENGGIGTITEQKRYRMHIRIERNSTASNKAKRYHGTSCQCCGFDFEKSYGALGAGFIEAHHLRPLNSLNEGEIVKYEVSDFAVLCSNCHRMIHRLADPSDLQALKRLVMQAR